MTISETLQESAIKEILLQHTSCIEEELEKQIVVLDTAYSKIFSAARYSLLAPGKRIRPLFTAIVAEMFGCPLKKSVPIACALEFIHTSSLIHDDLPCMDDDDFRRGKPSLHKAFDEGLAVLTGDYLLVYAFEVISENPELTDAQKVALISTLAKANGADGMIGGQVMDIAGIQTLEELKEMHIKKTGVLIAAALEFGAVLGNASLNEREILKNFGLNLGLAFQIIDDVLDVTECVNKRGVAASSDLTNGKKTYVSFLGVQGCQDLAKEITFNALNSLKALPYDYQILEYLAKSLINRVF